MLNYPHMKRIVSILSILGFLSFPLLTFAATTPAPNTLIKGSGSAVYYLATDSKRYVFPTEQTYFTWYDNFDNVVTISDTELATLPLGANVTYRPGTRMVKIESDPKVYAVAQNGSLRWVETEALAESLYGPNWATHIDDIPVGFFTSYILGTSIVSEQDYNPTEMKNAFLTIQDDLGIVTPEPAPEPVPPLPTPEPTVHGVLTASATSVASGGVIDVSTVADPSASIKDVYIYLDDAEEGYCQYSPCGASFVIPPGKTAYVLRAEFTWITGETVTQTLPITITAAGGNGVTLNITNPEVKPNGTREAIVLVDSSIVASVIQLFLDDNLVQNCDQTQECRYSTQESGQVGDVYTLYARVQNQGGAVVFSDTKTIAVVANDHPQLTLQLGKDYIFAGETIDATIQASDTDGLASTEIWVGDTLAKHCDISICTAILGPFSTTGTQAITAKATDTQGLEQTSSANFDVR